MTILTVPANTSSVSNEMLFVVSDAKAQDPATYPNYKYVLDIYVNSELVARLRAAPDPTHYYGVFNVSTILKNYVTYNFLANYSDQTCINPAKLSYQVKVGEEYDATTYTNLVTDVERSCFKSYAVRPFDSSAVVTDGTWASNSPSVVSVYKSQKWHLLNYYEDSYPGSTVDVVVNAYRENGTLLSTGNYSSRPVENTKFLQINGGFVKAQGVMIDDTAAYYTFNVSGVTKRLNVLCDGKYPVTTLVWLNQYGAYESQQFGLVSKKEIAVERKQFSQLPYQLDASGVPSYSSDGVFYGGKRGFATDVTVSLRMTSHLLTDEEYRWLSEIFISPDVYMYSATLDKFFPVSVRENQYEYRTYANSKLTPLQLSVEFSDHYNGQYL